MTNLNPNAPLDYAAIEAQARQMRAEAVASGVKAIATWMKSGLASLHLVSKAKTA